MGVPLSILMGFSMIFSPSSELGDPPLMETPIWETQRPSAQHQGTALGASAWTSGLPFTRWGPFAVDFLPFFLIDTLRILGGYSSFNTWTLGNHEAMKCQWDNCALILGSQSPSLPGSDKWLTKHVTRFLKDHRNPTSPGTWLRGILSTSITSSRWTKTTSFRLVQECSRWKKPTSLFGLIWL